MGTLQALRSRQVATAAAHQDLIREAVASAPFTTGLGIEHPLENGFAFLDPYGLPYLPGSGVKGVVRRAAEELALFERDPKGWSIPAVWWLFGFDANSAFFAHNSDDLPKVVADEMHAWKEAYQRHIRELNSDGQELFTSFCTAVASAAYPKEVIVHALRGDGKQEPIHHVHLRGALEFWDVIPEPAQGKLRVDIMNPHYNHYYQEGQPPGDWGNPVPIDFLTLPPGSKFTFIVRFRPPNLWPPEVRRVLEPQWMKLVSAALEFAWDWQGFGAKTAVGYGRMGAVSKKPLPTIQSPKAPGGA
ncbi:MAG: type III-B CRISPR module RAMP protein Cmr6 [Thermoanaerobaculum sp.]|nr:type III-B CRISPR module RAMP protein Cmr6 [Thermoanaerobaculum sp.]